jgi:cobyrinic acid a,c-diamide synthase
VNSETIRIGVARDNAFCFYYEDNLDILRGFGAELVFFSPITDAPPDDLHGLYLGGGYPELFADRLAGNVRMREWIRVKSRDGMPIYAECGGFMYLCEEISDLSGDRHPMTGVFPFVTRMLPKLKALGYREIRLTTDTPLGPAGTTARGHEFHYSERIASSEGVETVYAVADRKGGRAAAEGYRRNRTIGSYIHLHFGSRPSVAEDFIYACLGYRRERIQ